MSDNEMLYFLIAFIIGWLSNRMIGDGFSVGIVDGQEISRRREAYKKCKETKGANQDQDCEWWMGANKNYRKCKDGYDIQTKCKKCVGEYDGRWQHQRPTLESLCQNCHNDNYNKDSECTQCKEGYDIHTKCTNCTNIEHDPENNCEKKCPKWKPNTGGENGNCSGCHYEEQLKKIYPYYPWIENSARALMRPLIWKETSANIAWARNYPNRKFACQNCKYDCESDTLSCKKLHNQKTECNPEWGDECGGCPYFVEATAPGGGVIVRRAQHWSDAKMKGVNKCLSNNMDSKSTSYFDIDIHDSGKSAGTLYCKEKKTQL